MNREIVNGGGAGIYPLQGDVQSTAGNKTVKVAGILNVPIVGAPVDGDVLCFVASTNQWNPEGGDSSILVEDEKVSFDFLVLVNGVSAIGTFLAIYVNGASI